MRLRTDRGAMRLVIGILATVSLASLMASAQNPPPEKPIKETGLVKAIKLNAFTTRELIRKIESRGVDFQVTPDVERELTDAGARPELVEACRKNYRPAPPPKSSNPTNATSKESSSPPAPDASSPATPDASSETHSSGPPLNSDEVLTLLQSGVPSARVEKIVADRGVAFTLNPEVSQSLRAAGGTPSLIAAIAEHAVASASEAEPASSSPAPASAPSLPSQPDNSAEYDDLIGKATDAIGANNTYEASQNAEAAVKLDPSKPDAYTVLGYVQLYSNHNYVAAERAMRKAIEHGGHATFRVYHDHTGVFSSYCTGSMFIGKDAVTFKANDGKHTFEANRSDIKEAKSNGFVGAMFAAFHIKVKEENGRTKNYNFAPLGDTDGTLPDRTGPPSAENKAEQELILRLILDYGDGSSSKK